MILNMTRVKMTNTKGEMCIARENNLEQLKEQVK